MEGVPRLPMLKCEYKRSPDNEGISRRLRELIQGRYGDSNCEEEIREFKSLRATSCILVSRNVSGVSEVKKYYAQLSFLKNRLRLEDEDEGGGIPWSWYNLYAAAGEGNSVIMAFTDIGLEMSSVLYNAGALHSILAAEEGRVSSEEMKMACTHFQCAAWAFHTIPDRCSNLRSTDLDPDILAFLSQVCLAQAQECILEKSILDHRKATIVAKVGAQVVDYYLQAKKKLDGSRIEEENISEIVGSKLAKAWLLYVDFKMHFYTAVSFYYMGLQSEEAQKMGERVAYLEAASGSLKTAASKGKVLVSSSLAGKMFDKGLIGSALSFSSDVINGKLDNAKKENEFIYHDGVPDINTLPELKGASLVKGIGFEVTDVEISGKDIFSKLVPMEAHESSSLYSEEKAKLLRNIGDEVEKKDSDLAVFLTSLSLDEIPEPGQQVSLPSELIECVAGLSVKKDAIGKLAQAMKQIDTVTCGVDSAIKDLEDVLKREEQEEKEFEVLMGTKRTSSLNTDMKRELQTFMEARSAASESTLTLHNAMELHLENFNLLSKPLEELEKIIPSMKDLDDESESNLGEMLRIYDKVKEMKSQRLFLLEKLREQVQGDDITKKLILHKNKDLSEVFSFELKKYDSTITLLRTNLEAQGNILHIFADINAKYVDTRCAISQLLVSRKDMINSLIESYHTYDELLHKTAKGLQFYDKLESNVSKALSKAKGIVKVQAEERDALIAKNHGGNNYSEGSFSRPSAPSGPSKPTLKDYLNAMKAGEQQSSTKAALEKNTPPPSAAPLNYPPPTSTYTSGSLPSSNNNMTLATASPQIQQQEQYRQYYQPPSTPPAYYQYPPSNALDKSSGGSPSDKTSAAHNSMMPSPHVPPQPYYGQAYANSPQYYNQNMSVPNNGGITPPKYPYAANSHHQYPNNSSSIPTPSAGSNQYPPSYNYAQPQQQVSSYPPSTAAPTQQMSSYPPSTAPPTQQMSSYPPSSTVVPTQASQQHYMMSGGQQRPSSVGSQQHNPFLVPAASGSQYGGHAYGSQAQPMPYAQPYSNQGGFANYNPSHAQYNAPTPQHPKPATSNVTPQQPMNNTAGVASPPSQQQPMNNTAGVAAPPTHQQQPMNSTGGVAAPPTIQQQPMNSTAGVAVPPSHHQQQPRTNNTQQPFFGSPQYNATPINPSVIPLSPAPPLCPSNGEGRKSSVDKILSASPEESSKKADTSNKVISDSSVLTPKVMTASDLEEEKEIAKITKEIQDANARDPFEASESLRQTLLEETNALESLLREVLAPNSLALEKIWKEVKSVFEEGPVLKISVARCYPMKNRDADVLPYDNNRVELPSTKDDYINASHIKGLSQHSPRFIATQSPTSGTLSDFWIMVWQEQVETLVNLVPLETLSTFVYWPEDRKTPLKVGSLQITLQSSKNETPSLTEKIMTILNQATNTSRVVVFIQATKQITDKSLLLDVVHLLLKYHRQQRVLTHPLVIHCVHGSFRTASVILLASMLSEINVGASGDLSSLPLLAGALMRQRKGVLREKESLKLIYEALFLHCHGILVKHALKTPLVDPSPLSAPHEKNEESSLSSSMGKLLVGPPAEDSPLKKITKQDFLKPSSGLNPDFKSDDPLSQLDPLWSLKSKTT